MAILQHLHKHGITKSAMHHALVNRFMLTPEQVSACENYYILHWRGAHFKQELTEGSITHKGIQYLVVYKDCKPTEIKSQTTLWLSFRKPAKEFELQAYVLVLIRD